MTVRETMFCVLGAQKSGTTWLYQYLNRHPQVFMPMVKETNYFHAKHNGAVSNEIARLLNSLNNSVDTSGVHPKLLESARFGRIGDAGKILAAYTERGSYLNIFSSRKKEHRTFGELSPAYSLLDADGFREIEQQHENVRFVFIMRDPVSRFWSAIRMLVERKPKVLRGNSGVEGVFYKHLYDQCSEIRRMSDYRSTILELETAVAREKILYLFYEDLFGPQGRESVAAFTDFLNIDLVEPELDKVVWKTSSKVVRENSLTAEMKSDAQRHFSDVYEFLGDRFGLKLPSRWLNPDAISEGAK